jgi:hypothetical protein
MQLQMELPVLLQPLVPIMQTEQQLIMLAIMQAPELTAANRRQSTITASFAFGWKRPPVCGGLLFSQTVHPPSLRRDSPQLTAQPLIYSRLSTDMTRFLKAALTFNTQTES